MFMENHELVGEVQTRITSDNMLVITRRDGVYRAEFCGYGGGSEVGDCININGAASGMKNDSYLEFGGDRTKRLTVTETERNTYLYVEVGGR